MIKLRDARYCNLKLLLIFLVVYGHLIEPQTGQSAVAMAQYKGIYLFHMPLFAFLSGLFLRDGKTCKQQCRRMLALYAPLQALTVCLGKATPWTPHWHLWYLLSYSTWAGLAFLWFRFFKKKSKYLILTASVLLGCLAGLCPYIGRAFSLSRTLVFFPYFWLGLICDPHAPWEKLRKFSPFVLAVLSASLLLWGDRLFADFLYQATPYGTVEHGIALRLLCYFLSLLMGLLLLAWMPTRRFPFTKAGADTLPAYLIHAPIVSRIRTWGLPWPWHLLLAAGILYIIYRFLQWHGRLYGIVPTERRGSRCLLFKKSTKHMPSRSIDSC